MFLVAVLNPGKISSQGLFNKTGVALVANGNVYFVVNNGGLRNDGAFIKGSSTMLFSGNNSTSGTFISGSSATGFYNLTLNKTSNGLQLNSDITVSGTVTFQSGDSIDLNNHIVNLGTSGTISGESNSSRFTGLNGGYITLNRMLTVPTNVNPGNIGVSITSASNLGNTLIKRYHTIQKNKSASREYEIVPDNNSSLAATVIFYYFHSEMNSISETSLSAYYSENSGSTWSQLPNTTLNTTTNTLTTVGLNSFNIYTLFKNGVPLPVKLLYFNGKLVNHAGLLNWATAAEAGNDHFDVEHSANGVQFTAIGTVQGAGNSAADQFYSFTDKQILPGINYYRLKQVDKDGQYTYSEIAVIKNSLSQQAISIFPNPASLYLNTKIITEKEGDVLFVVTNQTGVLYKEKQVHLSAGVNFISLPVNDLARGQYILQTRGLINESTQFIKY